MIQISIVKESQITNQASFPTMEEAQAWLSSHEGMGTFGQKKETVERQVEIAPAVMDSEGVEISPAQFEAQMVELEGYTVEMLDVSAQLEQEATNAAAKAYLASTDYIVVRAMERGEELSAEFKTQRQIARDSIV
jgi:hypothetical protein